MLDQFQQERPPAETFIGAVRVARIGKEAVLIGSRYLAFTVDRLLVLADVAGGDDSSQVRPKVEAQVAWTSAAALRLETDGSLTLLGTNGATLLTVQAVAEDRAALTVGFDSPRDSRDRAAELGGESLGILARVRPQTTLDIAVDKEPARSRGWRIIRANFPF